MANAIDWLETAGLIIKVHIAHQSKFPLKSLVKENTFKLFMFDIGILGAMMDLVPSTILAYDYGTYKGFLMLCIKAFSLTQVLDKNAHSRYIAEQ
jgi:hypothetical protein